MIDLIDMSKTEALQLSGRQVTKQVLLDEQIAVNELLETLTYLPPAIVQVATFINRNNISVSEYLSLFRNAGTEAELFSEHFEDLSRHQQMDNMIAKTWQISFEQVCR